MMTRKKKLMLFVCGCLVGHTIYKHLFRKPDERTEEDNSVSPEDIKIDYVNVFPNPIGVKTNLTNTHNNPE